MSLDSQKTIDAIDNLREMLPPKLAGKLDRITFDIREINEIENSLQCLKEEAIKKHEEVQWAIQEYEYTHSQALTKRLLQIERFRKSLLAKLEKLTKAQNND